MWKKTPLQKKNVAVCFHTAETWMYITQNQKHYIIIAEMLAIDDLPCSRMEDLGFITDVSMAQAEAVQYLLINDLQFSV